MLGYHPVVQRRAIEGHKQILMQCGLPLAQRCASIRGLIGQFLRQARQQSAKVGLGFLPIRDIQRTKIAFRFLRRLKRASFSADFNNDRLRRQRPPVRQRW